jgi:hypothetical protein
MADDHAEHRADDRADDQALRAVRDAFDVVGPVPADAHDAALAAFGLRDLDGQLADLVFDSWLQEHATVQMRSLAEAPRLLSFAGAAGALDVELRGDGTFVGQVSLDRGHAGATVEAQSPHGDVITVPVDELGRFRGSVGFTTVRLRVPGVLTTAWISR